MTTTHPWVAPASVRRPSATDRLTRGLRGPDRDAAWVRPALLALLATTATLYVWGLSRSGWANDYYAAAVQAGSQSWKAFFFGSFDAGELHHRRQDPASLWLLELSARVFGFNSWSLLVPQALMGVATVGVTVRGGPPVRRPRRRAHRRRGRWRSPRSRR